MVDAAVRALFYSQARSRLALIAVGGYGRAQLSPGSDVDLIMLHRARDRGQAEEAFGRVLYPLWDAGLQVGHALRTAEECAQESEHRLESLTTLLTARLVAGSRSLFQQLVRTASGAVAADPARFMAGLRQWRDDRRARAGSVGEKLEPDVKEGLGGLRDLHLLVYLLSLERVGRSTVASEGVRPSRKSPVRALASMGTLRPEEATLVDDGGRFLLVVREALQRRTGDASNVLAADQQEAVATSLGLVGEEGWEPRDLLMRTVFGHARRIVLATRAALDRVELSEGLARPAARPTEKAALEHAPARLRGAGDLVRVLSDGDQNLQSIEVLEAVGSLSALIPEWDVVRGRPQRDPYHRYPVDVHLIRTAVEAATLLRDPDEAFAKEAVKVVDDSAALLLGALLHDIGKVGKGSHVSEGVAAAERALERLMVTDRRRDDVLFLVGEHLLLSDTATRRNLEDEDLILHVAARVRDQRRLAMLYLLTMADALATGPAASTPWRMTLVRELVAKVHRAFEHGRMPRDRASRIERAESSLGAALRGAGVTDQAAGEFISIMPPGYLLWAQPESAPHHLGLVVPAPAAGARIDLRPGRSEATWTVAVGAPDRLGLLAVLAGALTLSGLSILAAQAFTTEGGVALDVFEVRGAFEEHVSEERWDRFRRLVAEAMNGTADLEARIRELRAHYRSARQDLPVVVRVDHQASDSYTVVEVGTADRLGLLFDLAGTFARLELDVHSAKVATFGPRVVDAFYVTERSGRKLSDPDLERRAVQALRHAASGA